MPVTDEYMIKFQCEVEVHNLFEEKKSEQVTNTVHFNGPGKT